MMTNYRASMADYIGDYVKHLRTLGRAESTITTYTEILHRLNRELPDGVARAHGDELVNWIWDGHRSPATIALYRAVCREFFAFVTDPDYPGVDYDSSRHLPAVRVPRRKARPPTTEVVADILDRAREPYRTWFVLAAYAGLRCCEIAALDRDHVTREMVWIHGKGSHEREIPTDAYVWAAVSTLPPGPVARGRDGERTTRQMVTDRGNRQLQLRLGHRDMVMHRLRHWAGTQFYRASGGDILATQRFLGHASVTTTQIYVEVASQAMVAAVAALPRVGAR